MVAPTAHRHQHQHQHQQVPAAAWMACRHLPERGVVAAPSSSSRDRGAQSSSASAGATSSTARRRLSRGRSGDEKMQAPQPSGGAAPPASSASDHKRSRKEAALDSLFPPTATEIGGHVRYLSEEAARLAMAEVDECAVRCLGYSSTAAKNELTMMEGGGEKSSVHNLSTLAEEIRGYLEMFQPDEEEGYEGGGNDATTLASATSPVSGECVETGEARAQSIVRSQDVLHDLLPEKYDPTLLPMITIKCHPNALDRIEMTKGLFSDLSGKKGGRSRSLNSRTHQMASKDGMRPCVCVIRSKSELVRQGHVMTEVLSQCITNDPDGESFAAELQRSRKRRMSSARGADDGVLVRSVWDWTRSLVDWAGCTEAFDSIVVILEDPEEIPSPTLDSFFTTVASLRSIHGVPVGVVVIDAIPGGLGDRLSMLRGQALRGTAGVVARDLFVPSPQVQLDIFVHELYAGSCIPTFLWTDRHLLKHIQESFREIDNSIVSVARQLKTMLRRYFSRPGAFVSLLGCDKFTIPNEARIKWLFGDENSRKVMMLSHPANITPPTKEDQKDDGHICNLFWKIQMAYLCHQICQRINGIFNLSPLGEIGQIARSQINMSRIHGLLQLLGNVREKVATWQYSSVASPEKYALLSKKLNEYIILLGKFESYDSEMAKSLTKSLVHDIMEWARWQFSLQIKLKDALPVQPRRDVAKALNSPIPNDLIHSPLSHASQIAFQVFQSRAMTLAEWHEKYFDVVSEREMRVVGVSSSEAAFFCAVYELVHCGFVRKLLMGRRKEEAYEKVALVWGGGR